MMSGSEPSSGNEPGSGNELGSGNEPDRVGKPVAVRSTRPAEPKNGSSEKSLGAVEY